MPKKKAPAAPTLDWIAEPLRPLAVEVGELTPDPANARRHPERNLEAIRGSLRLYGQRKPLVVRRAGMVVMAGNGTLTAAKALGWSHVACVVVDDDATTATGFAIADNRTGELAEWDGEALSRLLDDLKAEDVPVAEFGLDDEELASLLADLDVAPEPEEPGEDPGAGEPPAEPVSQRGEVYALGPHRLMCGDSTSAEDVAALLGEDRPIMLVTDPPYSSGGRQENARRGATSVGRRGSTVEEIARDNLTSDGYRELLRSVVQRVESCDLAYVFTDWRMWNATHGVLEASGFPVRSMIVWAKPAAGMGYPWQNQHELVAYARRSSPGTATAGTGSRGNVLAVGRDTEAMALHPTGKPVEVIEPLLTNTAPPGDVYDPFLGSGTTLIAAARQGRRCFGLEISPAYCDVIRKRWGDYARANDLDPGPDAL